MNWILKHWRGEYSLKTSFWLNTILVNFIVSLPFSFVLIDLLQSGQENLFLRVLLNFQLLRILISVWQAVGVYRSSVYSLLSGKSFWGFVARVMVIVFTANAILSALMVWYHSEQVLGMWLKALEIS